MSAVRMPVEEKKVESQNSALESAVYTDEDADIFIQALESSDDESVVRTCEKVTPAFFDLVIHFTERNGINLFNIIVKRHNPLSVLNACLALGMDPVFLNVGYGCRLK